MDPFKIGRVCEHDTHDVITGAGNKVAFLNFRDIHHRCLEGIQRLLMLAVQGNLNEGASWEAAGHREVDKAVGL